MFFRLNNQDGGKQGPYVKPAKKYDLLTLARRPPDRFPPWSASRNTTRSRYSFLFASVSASVVRGSWHEAREQATAVFSFESTKKVVQR